MTLRRRWQALVAVHMTIFAAGLVLGFLPEVLATPPWVYRLGLVLVLAGPLTLWVTGSLLMRCPVCGSCVLYLWPRLTHLLPFCPQCGHPTDKAFSKGGAIG